jgi:hypothetical protein
MGLEEDASKAIPIVRKMEGSMEALLPCQDDNEEWNCGTGTLN